MSKALSTTKPLVSLHLDNEDNEDNDFTKTVSRFYFLQKLQK
nr:MAG TPA: FIBRONECTIN, FIBRONECTIN BINDING PROTEIN ADHESION-COMPLEX, HOST-PATHOGEN PROTEIN COMPLEX [Caudoviricetes sp.]